MQQSRTYKQQQKLQIVVCHAERRSISDYVGGVHGGKYCFGNEINYETSYIRSSNDNEQQKILAPIPIEENNPKWATRPIPLNDFYDTVINMNDKESTISIQNEEISWEPFYVTFEAEVVSDDGDDNKKKVDVEKEEMLLSSFSVMPSSGNLAPRGGMKEFTDICQLTVSFLDDDKSSTQENCGYIEEHDIYLVVRTEQNVWCWRLET